jgi:hypothetical protein
VKARRSEERFLTAQADRFAGAKRKENASACSVRNDLVAGVPRRKLTRAGVATRAREIAQALELGR